jgi:hypothetical protein
LRGAQNCSKSNFSTIRLNFIPFVIVFMKNKWTKALTE